MVQECKTDFVYPDRNIHSADIIKNNLTPSDTQHFTTKDLRQNTEMCTFHYENSDMELRDKKEPTIHSTLESNPTN